MAETWSERLIRAALRIQDKIAPQVPREVRRASVGRKGRLFIEGEDGGLFYLKWDGEELVEEFDATNVRNDFHMYSQTLLDLATGELGVREAIAARLINISGDRSLYDTEEVVKLLERLQSKLTSTVRSRTEIH